MATLSATDPDGKIVTLYGLDDDIMYIVDEIEEVGYIITYIVARDRNDNNPEGPVPGSVFILYQLI